MNKKLLVSMLLCFFVFFSCSTEKKGWEKAETANTITAYEEFLKLYPEGEFVDKAHSRIESIYFDEASAANTIASYEDFLKLYPEGEFADSAHSQIEAIYFDQAKAANSIEAYKDFLERYPKGEFADSVRLLLEKIYPSFSKEKVLIIKSISSVVGKGEVSFTKGSKPNTLKITINVTVPVVNGKTCMGCGAIVRIAPNLKIPIKPWFVPTEFQGQSVTFTNSSFEGPTPADVTEFIVSGPQGATLKKEGKGFRLVEGEAHFLQKKQVK